MAGSAVVLAAGDGSNDFDLVAVFERRRSVVGFGHELEIQGRRKWRPCTSHAQCISERGDSVDVMRDAVYKNLHRNFGWGVSGDSRLSQLAVLRVFNPQVKAASKLAVAGSQKFHHDVQHGRRNQKTVAVQAVDLQ